MLVANIEFVLPSDEASPPAEPRCGTLNFNFLINGVNGFIGFNNIKTMNINNIEYILLVDNDENDAFINSDNEPLTIGSYKIML